MQYAASVSISDYRENEIKREVKKALAGPGVTLTKVLESIRKHYGDKVYDKACLAAKSASYHPIPMGTLNPDGTFIMTTSGWQPVSDYADPRIQDAMQLAGTLARGLKRHHENQDSTLLNLTRKLDAQYRQRHLAYPLDILKRLSGRFPSLALLLGHIKNEKLTLPTYQEKKLEVSGTPLEIASQLADLLQLTEENLAHYAKLSPQDAEQLLLTHYCFNGEIWMAPELYYAGNAYTKSEHCRTLASQFTGVRAQALRNQAGGFLSRIQPVTSLDELRISPRDPIVPTAALEAWVNFQLGSIRNDKHLINVTRESSTIKFSVKTAQNYEAAQIMNAFSQADATALEAFLNHRTKVARIEDAKEMTKDEYQAERAAAMEEAADYEQRMTTSFQSWLAGSPYVGETLSAYNKARNSNIIPKGLTHPLPVEWGGPPPHPYQNSDARTLATQEGGCAGYGVGVGKTFLGLLLTGYLHKLALITKPVIVAPAGLVSNWMTSATLCYPKWKILSIGMSPVFNADGTPKQKTCLDGTPMFDERGKPVYEWKEDSAAVRQQKLGQLAAGDCDLAIMSRDVYTSIPLSGETLERLISQDLQYRARLEAQEGFNPKSRKGRHDTLKRLTEFQAKCVSKIKQAKSTDLSFEALGIDATFLDESQAYKNRVSAPSTFGEAVKFIGGGAESNRALDAAYKNIYVRERGGKTYTFTASWVKNSPLEVWTSLGLVTDSLPDLGLPTTETMMDQYLKIEPRIITSLDGDVAVRPAAVGFRKLRELKSVIDSRIIVRHPGDPEVILSTGEPMHVPRVEEIEYPFDMTAEQAEQYAKLRTQAAAAGNKGTGENHTFSIMWKMRKLTLDPCLSLSNPGAEEDIDDANPLLLPTIFAPQPRNPRFEAAADIALKERTEGGKVLIFMSIGEKEGSFERLRDTLIQKGYPANEIEIVTAATHKSSVARQDLEDRYNYGGLTCLLLSSVAEEGFNLQIGTSAIIHCDIPWNFQSVNQRNGRGARQGNTRDVVRSYYLLMRGSFDTLTYTILRGKKAWEDQLDGQHDEVENSAAEFNADEIALLLAENPEAMRKRIEEKKAELQERSGRAAQKRRLMALHKARVMRQGLLDTINVANSRKKGWTAQDHVRVSNAKLSFERAMMNLDDVSTYPMAKLVTYKKQVHWEFGIPFHQGLTFSIGETTYQVIRMESNAALVEDKSTGTCSHLNYHHISRNAENFQPDPDETHYDTTPVTQGIQTMEVVWPKDAPITVMNGQTVNPATRSDGVLTIAISGGKVETLSGCTEENLRAHIMNGKTLIHYLTHEAENAIAIEHVAVLCPNEEIKQKTLAIANHPAFAQRLADLMKKAAS